MWSQGRAIKEGVPGKDMSYDCLYRNEVEMKRSDILVKKDCQKSDKHLQKGSFVKREQYMVKG